MTPTTTSTCRNCGGAVLQGDRFCGNCGTPVVGTPAPATQASGAGGASATAASTRSTLGIDTSPWAAVAARLQAATLGEFEIATELGRGGMAAVYLARDLALNRRVAIKVMAPGLLLGPGMVDRFRQEAVTVANLQHAHIVSIHAVRQLEDLHFFVMQFVPGRTLERVLRDGETLSIEVVRAWLYQVGSALSYAHRRGVIHRDIKPGNILLNSDGEAIVTDFGIAKVAESPTHTQTGTVVGTPVYMSPEQCYAKELTGASDQYSLGIVAYEMLAGKPPFSGSSFALMRAHTDEPPPPIEAVRPDVPPEMRAALMRMLAKRPEDRFATMGEALSALGAAPLAPDAPLHATLQALAAATERLEALGDVLRTPASPVPRTRERVKATPVTPRTPVPSTEALVVVIAPAPTDLEPGATATLRATLRNAAGQALPGDALQWASSDPSIVTAHAATGQITAVAEGHAIVTATAGSAHDAVDVTVGRPRAAVITIDAPTSALEPGDRAEVVATVMSRFDVPIEQPVEWSTDDPDVASIDRAALRDDGRRATLVGIGAGAVGVTATCDGVVSRATVRVVAPPVLAPPTTAKSAVPPASATEVLAVRPPAAPATPAADRVSREHTPVAPPPPAPVHAAPPSSEASAPIAPARPAPASAEPAPRIERTAPPRPSGPARAGSRRLLLAAPVLLVGAIGAYVLMRPGTGSVATTDTARITTTDSTTPTRPDSIPIAAVDTSASVQPRVAADSAANGNTAARADSAPPPARAVARRIDLTPQRPASLTPGETVQLSAVVRDADGRRMPDARVSWSSGTPSVATADATGRVTAVGPGAARITARAGDNGGVSSAVTITVVAPAPDPTVVASLDIGDVRTLTVGESARATATPRNAAGGAIPSASVTWSSSNSDVASVAPNGTITARAPGASTIRATAGGVSAERAIAVRAREVTRADTPAASEKPPAKSEAELRSEVQAAFAAYVRAVESRDTSQVHRLWQNAPPAVLQSWQATFDDARDGLQFTGTSQLLDAPRDVVGSQVRVQARYSLRFRSRRDRRDVTVPSAFTAVIQRDANGWHIAAIR